MDIPVKSLKSGFSLPEIGIGAWPMGGYRSRDLKNKDEDDVSAIRYALDRGITHIDTAEIYGDGRSEELVGAAIKGYDRTKLQIASKVSGRRPPEEMQKACRASLERVGSDYFDMYYIHWREASFGRPNHNLADQMKAMEVLVDQGLIKHIAVSDFSTESLKEAQSLCKYPIVANQVHYNLIFRESEEDGLVDYCQKNDVLLMAWRPLELGKLAKTGNAQILNAADKYNVSHAAVALNWLTSQKNVVTLFKSSMPQHIDENLECLGWYMEEDDIEGMRRNYPGQINVSDAVPLA